MKARSALGFLLLLSIVMFVCLATHANAQSPKTWAWEFKDIRDRPVTRSLFLGRISIVSLANLSGRSAAEAAGKAVGDQFGSRKEFQSIAVPDTSSVPFLFLPFATLTIRSAEEQAIRDALEKHKKLGKPLERSDVETKLYFLQDNSGDIRQTIFGADADAPFMMALVDHHAEIIKTFVTPTPEQVLPEIAALFKSCTTCDQK